MTPTHTLASALLLASLGLAWAQTPGGSTSPPAGTEAAGPMGGGSGPATEGSMTPEMRARMQSHMQAMRELRARMNAAGSAGERQSLMEEHLRLMDESMTLMQQLMGPHMGGRGGMPMPMHGPGMQGPGMPPGAPGSTGSPGTPGVPGSPGSVR